jgi:hypothetical protein
MRSVLWINCENAGPCSGGWKTVCGWQPGTRTYSGLATSDCVCVIKTFGITCNSELLSLSVATRFCKVIFREIPRLRANSAVRLEIPWPAENCGPYSCLLWYPPQTLYTSLVLQFTRMLIYVSLAVQAPTDLALTNGWRYQWHIIKNVVYGLFSSLLYSIFESIESLEPCTIAYSISQTF